MKGRTMEIAGQKVHLQIDDRGSFRVNVGNRTFGYQWNKRGEAFRAFLRDIFLNDPVYLYEKTHDQSLSNRVDVEKTIRNMKREIIRFRKIGGLYSCPREISPTEARFLWDDLELMEKTTDMCSAEDFEFFYYHELNEEERRKVFDDESFFSGSIVVYRQDEEARWFCEEAAPELARLPWDVENGKGTRR
ncbi:hypothetical protein IMZ31_20050 (plasmid) [Pontibacillus sp. ALD_SL1]|uniref:hypothetical protein n=1 Tax=Pontibacillus sp. ALD_SL1 TaxID=2777185 RepID=UPI001A9730DB|nr:hypothetical protein [Pontibacillus sp. ALD_SL1]QST02845.1 hypothetical protein IMZ31_20050 [Pontibacillus sp. ALD_SL1]